jgi:hypothetical protein
MQVLYAFLVIFFSVTFKVIAGPNDHDANGDTPLIKAIFEQNTAAVKQLMEEGGDPRVKKADGKSSGYDFAFWGKNLEIKKMVLDFQDPQSGETLLLKEVFNGDVLKVKEYLDLGANPYLQKKDKTDAIAFAIWGNSKLIQDMLVNYQDPATGETPLIKALYEKNVDLVKTLLNNGARIDLKKKDDAGPFDFLEWMPAGEGKDQITKMMFDSLDDPRRDDGNFISTKKLLTQNPSAPILQAFMQIPLQKTGVDRYVLNVQKCPYGGTFGPPAAPVFHRYHGQGYYALSIKFPKEFLVNIPEDIKGALLKFDLDEIDFYMVTQGTEDGLLFRPHYWMNPNLPDQFVGVMDRNFLQVAMFDPTESIASNELGGLTDNQLKIFEFVAHDSRISPDSASVKKLGKDFSGFVWTLTIDNNRKDRPKRAAVTLHAFMEWGDARDLGRIYLDEKEKLQTLLGLQPTTPYLDKLIEQLKNILKI